MRRALVLGSETGLLQGAHRDAERVRAALAALGFDVDLRVGEQATRAGILDGCETLAGRAEAGDACVIYYSGHGVWERAPAGDGPAARERRQGLVPWDYARSTPDDFRGLLAEELSLELWRLAQRTRNAAVILDCCHAALLCRGARAVPKALPHPGWVGVERALEALHARATEAELAAALAPGGSDAVRLVACRTEESAFEHDGPDGEPCGVFTEGLLAALAGADDLTWRELGERAAEHVRLLFPGQTPGVEGRASRRVFGLDEPAREPTAPLVDTLDGWTLRRGRVHGVRAGDRWQVRGPDGRPSGEARVTEVRATEARVALSPAGCAPAGARAAPLAWSEPPRLVRVADGSEQPDALDAAIARSGRVARAREASEAVVATVAIRGGALALEDADGLPLFEPTPATPERLARLPDDLARVAHARALRELTDPGIDGVPAEALEVSWGLAPTGGCKDTEVEPLPLAGATVGPGDAIFLRLRSAADRPLYAHVFDLDPADAVTRLTARHATGVLLQPGREELFDRDRRSGLVVGTPFTWPASVPAASGPRAAELLILATTAPADLAALEQGAVTRGRAPSRLEALLAQARGGGTRGFSAFGPPADDGVLVRRVRFTASPVPVPRSAATFAVDEARPPLDAVARPRGGRAATRLAIELERLVIHDNRALFGAADVRVDALVVAPGQPRAYLTETLRFPRVRDGDALPLDRLVVYQGAVRDLVQLCLWVSRDDAAALDLGELLAREANDAGVQAALGALAALAVAAPQAALIVGAVGAAATLANVGQRVLLAALGKTIGLYRTTLLPVDGYRVGRHPAEGEIRAMDLSFALRVREV